MQRHPTYSFLRPSALKIVLAAAAGFYIVFIVRSSFRIAGITYFTLIDDAMVSMRYAQHLAEGFGLVWNVGDKPIEGFTNPGWMLFMALLHVLRLPAPTISGAVMGAAAVILLANAYVAHRICAALAPGAKYGPLIAAAVTAFYFPLVFWSLRGMEVGLLSLLVSTGVLVAVQPRGEGSWQSAALLGAIIFAAILVRLDAVLQTGIIALYVISARKRNLPATFVPLLILVLTVAGILLVQKAYFGDFLPNTYYQKVVGASLADRVKNGLLAFNDYASRDTVMLAAIAAAGILLYKKLRNREVALLGLLFMVQCAYSVYVGGDYAEPEVAAANRFITQGMPALIILFGIVLERLSSDIRARRTEAAPSRPAMQGLISVAVAGATLLVISGQPWINWGIDNAPLLKADIRRVKIGLAIAQYTSPQATVAVHAAGQIPYFSGRRTIDLLGLNDPVVAKGPVTGPFYPGHDKWNYEYSILQLKPDLIADNWVKLGDFMRQAPEYQQLDNGMYVRKDSSLVDVQGLVGATR